MRQLPRKFFGRVAVWPRGQPEGPGMFRLLLEYQFLRYMLTLAPLIGIALIWTGLALPMSQAPLLMIVIIWWVEMRVLRVPKSRRPKLMDAAEAERGLDLLRVQGRDVLTRIAAGRGMRAGLLHLVVEQSELGRLPPVTYVSVQSEEGPEVLRLTPEERNILRDRLFQGSLTERGLHRINQFRGAFLHDIAFDARGVSAHARLEAALA